MEKQEVINCPLCKEWVAWVLTVKDVSGEWQTTYGCKNRCNEPTNIYLGEQK